MTPQLKIENDYWYISYDNGASWTQLGKATGEKGDKGEQGEQGEKGEQGEPGTPGTGGDSIFQSVTQDETQVYFTLADGTVIILPKRSGLDIVFTETEGIACLPGGSVKLAYTVTGGDEGTKVECVGDGGWRTKVSGGLEGTVTVTAPDPMTEGKVLVFATNGAGQVVMRALTFTEGVLSTVMDAYEVNAEGGTVEVEITTNMEYEVYIPEHAKKWVTLEPETRAEMRTDVPRFSVRQNLSGARRDAVIELQDTEGVCLRSFTIMQRYVPTDDIIVFADDQVRKACVGRWDTNGDLELSLEEAAAVTDVTGLFSNLKTITSFDEFRYFTRIKEVPQDFCKSCIHLTSIRLPEGISKIGGDAFMGCSALVSVNVPESVTELGGGMYGSVFSGCANLVFVELPEGVKNIPSGLFNGCSKLESITIPPKVTSIGYMAFQNCSSLKTIVIPNEVTSIEFSAFEGCSSLISATLPYSLKSIGSYTFSGCNNLKAIYCQSILPPTGAKSAFSNFMATIYVPMQSKELYEIAEGWKDFPEIIEMDFSANN